MPELPEVEFARTCLERWLVGEKLVRVEADAGRVIRGSKGEAFQSLAGRRVTKVERRGKWLLWRFDAPLGLLAHLGMTGKFELQPPGDPSVRWSRVRFARRDGATVHYRDPRQFGRLEVAPLIELEAKDPLASLGPDAYEPKLTSQQLAKRIGKGRRPIKDVLMDQTVLAGLGNIQVTEALFVARIHPMHRADALGKSEISRLARGIRRSLERTLAMNRGDKITYVEETKRVENPFFIYGKARSPCPRCGEVLKKMVISGRTTAFCPSCQKRKPATHP